MERAVEAPAGVLVLGHVRVGDVEREDVVHDTFVEAPLVHLYQCLERAARHGRPRVEGGGEVEPPCQ